MFLVEELNREKFVVGAGNLKREAASRDAFGLEIGVGRSAVTVTFS